MQPFRQDTAVGCEVAGPPKKMTSYRTWLFSGGWPRFEERAYRPGPSRVGWTRAASGAMMQGYLCELMIDLFGEGWLGRGRLSLKFIRIVDVGDTITA